MNKRKTITIVPGQKQFIDQFKDSGTRITDEHLPTSIKQDLALFDAALWGGMEISRRPRGI